RRPSKARCFCCSKTRFPQGSVSHARGSWFHRPAFGPLQASHIQGTESPCLKRLRRWHSSGGLFSWPTFGQSAAPCKIERRIESLRTAVPLHSANLNGPIAMTVRYSHVAPRHLQEAVERLTTRDQLTPLLTPIELRRRAKNEAARPKRLKVLLLEV